ncbi:MAG TPA: class I SAM-dependent methyltransferase, partial [Methanocella sp.]|nr:class I SAM-dependent methyltransferase [Methanocella sp.]
MMGLAYWEKAWENARARSPVAPGNTDGPGWLTYWDYVAGQSAGPGGGDDPSDAEVIDYLRREGVFRPGDRVLDVGCGTGTYALQFARAAGSVLGLDPSRFMLSKMAAAAGRLREGSVRTVMSRWEDYEPRDRYDLVFAAFCPGVHDPETLWKMEACSTRSCCYIAGDRSHFQLL